MTPHEAMEEAVDDLLQQIEDNYQSILIRTKCPDNALSRFVYYTDVISMLDGAPYPDTIMMQTLSMKLFLLRSSYAVDAEFIKIMYPGTYEI